MSEAVRRPGADSPPDPLVIFGLGGLLMLFSLAYVWGAATVTESFSGVRNVGGAFVPLAGLAALLFGLVLVWQFTTTLIVKWLRANPVALVIVGGIGLGLPAFVISKEIPRLSQVLTQMGGVKFALAVMMFAVLFVPPALPSLYLLVRGVPRLPGYLRRAVANREKFTWRNFFEGLARLGELPILLVSLPAMIAGNARATFRVLRIGAKNGDGKARYKLALAYLNGAGVQQDDVEAAQWMLKAAEQGNVEACCFLGFMYFFGRGLPLDETAGARWARLAAEAGDRNAQSLLGAAYAEGRGVPLDESQAAAWMRKAADQKDSRAQRMLGKMYEDGVGVSRDRSEAERWYLSAVELGDKEAQQLLDKLQTASITPAERGSGVRVTSPTRTPPSAPVRRTDQAHAQAFARLDALIGLDSVKRDVRSLADLVNARQWRQGASLPPLPKMSLHVAFTGNPGTGKTTVAREYAAICREIGVLSSGHLVEADRSKLISEYANATAKHARTVIDSALGGVLFIDEAYDLIRPGQPGWDAGPEAVTVLLKSMEDHRDDLIVIVAGYSEPMERFLNSNPGLKSRFSNFIDFPDYSVGELCQVMDRMLASVEFVVGSDARRELQRIVVETYEKRDPGTWGNAREVEALLGKLAKAQAGRLSARSTRRELQTIELRDVVAAFGEKSD